MLNLLEALKLYLLTVVVFFGIDLVWLSVVANNFYQKHLGFLLSPKPNLVAAMSFYLLYIVGIVYFAILPGLEAESLLKTALSGALLGLIAYATYDLTNLATIKDWPLIVVVVDILWGTVLTGTVAFLTAFLFKRFF
jgi:uncharacterized membrane protein